MEKTEMAVLVVSCDKYSDLWPVFWACFNKNWHDCPFKKYIGSNNIICESDECSIETIRIGKDCSWAENVCNMLKAIPEPYVLMLLEDFFIDKLVSTSEICKRLQYVIRNKIDCLRLNPCPPPCNRLDKKLDIGEVEIGSPYYVSTQPAIWKKSSLSKLMISGYSAWDFELKNSKQSKLFNMKFCGSNHYVISHKNGVEQGKWYLSTAEFLNKIGIDVDTSLRGVINDKKLRRMFRLKKYRVKEWVFIKLKLYRR